MEMLEPEDHARYNDVSFRLHVLEQAREHLEKTRDALRAELQKKYQLRDCDCVNVETGEIIRGEG